MDQNISEEVALVSYNNDNTLHPLDMKTGSEKIDDQEMDSRSAVSGKQGSERNMISSEPKEDKVPATFELIFITIALALSVFCVSLVSNFESYSRATSPLFC